MISLALVTLLRIMSYLVLIRVIVSWLPIDRGNVIIQFIYNITEPILAPVRKMLFSSPLGKRLYLDFSPIIVLLLIDLLIIPIVRWLF